MRPIIDSLVKKEYDMRPLEQNEFRDKCREYPGTVQCLNECAFIPYKTVKQESLMEKITAASHRMPGDNAQNKYCLAVLAYVNVGSLYLSLAAQYSMYCMLTKEVEPVSIEDFIKDAGQGHILCSLDMKILKRMVDDIMMGYKLCGDIKVELVDIAEGISG